MSVGLGQLDHQNDPSDPGALAEAFELLFSGNPTPMWILDLDTLRFMAVNEAAFALYGYSNEEFLEMKATDIRAPEERPRFFAHMRSTKPNGSQGEWRHLLKDGSVIDVEINSHIMELGGRNALLVASKDISDRKKAETALRESEEQFRTIAENIKEVVLLRRVGARAFLYVSPSFEEVWGIPVSRLYEDPRAWRHGVHPEDKGELERQLTEGIGGPLELQFRIVRPDGEIRWIRGRRIPITDKSGKDNLIVGIAEDVTEARAEAEATLEREARLRILLEQVPAIIWTTDEQLRLVAGKGSLLERIGLAEKDLTDRSFEEYFGDSNHLGMVAHRRALAGEPNNFEFEAFEMVWRAYLEPLRDSDGDIRGVIGVALDVTESELSRRMLQETVGRLEKSNTDRRLLLDRLIEIQEEERRRVAADLHDELGQVLTSASLFIQSTRGASVESTQTILASLNGLLEEAVASVRRIAWNLKPPELDKEGLQAAIELLVGQTRSLHSIHFETTSVGKAARLLPEVELAVYRIVQEATTNIVKHSRASSASIVLSWTKNMLEVLIEDDGKGFETSSNRNGRACLGLSGMRERAISVGAELDVDSATGVGSLIRLRAPIRTN